MGLHANRLLAFARELQRASTFADLLEMARGEALRAVGFNHVWLFVGDREEPEQMRFIDAASTRREMIATEVQVIDVRGDAMLEELVRSDHPVVVVDARTDPRTNKELVARLGNRTIVNVPLRLLDRPFGALGMGTFGDEDCITPSPEQLDYLAGMASQLSVAVSRIRFLEERARAEEQRLDYERRIARMQRMESLGLLAGGIAHDFNNLLTVILTGTSLARMLPAEKRGEAGLDAAIEAARRGRDLTKQLLAMSRAQPKELCTYDLSLRLKQFLAMVRRIIPENIRIEVTTTPNLPPIEADPAQIDQVFLNLLINARDAMPDGGRIQIRTEEARLCAADVAAHPWAKPGRYVRTTVTDTGTGIPEEIADRVFEPFFSTKAEHCGTGLGLAVTHGIVRHHGGIVRCHNEPAGGATFEVHLPVWTCPGDEIQKLEEEPVRGGTERILVAEDDPAVRATTGSILESAGYHVVLVENGEAACERACQEAFDLVLLDAIMPKMSGREALPRIRALLPAARFLLSSGYAADVLGVLSREESTVPTLAKPYEPEALLRAVRRALDAPLVMWESG